MNRNEEPLNCSKSGAHQNIFNLQYSTNVSNHLSGLEGIRSIPIEIAVVFLSLKVLYKNKVRCPGPSHINGDRNPSLQLYLETNSWYCFTCCIGGSVIDLVMHVNHCSATEAICFLRGLYE